LALEIERKFLVVSDQWKSGALNHRQITDYLIARFEGESGKARIRICDAVAQLTIKGPRRGLTRSEFHVPLLPEDAASMINELARGAAIDKKRYEVKVHDFVWQVDEYLGALEGLVTCDGELPSEQTTFVKPSWAGTDVTGECRFSSSTLAAMLDSRDEAAIASLLALAT
jgi:adenylate cyclase